MLGNDGVLRLEVRVEPEGQNWSIMTAKEMWVRARLSSRSVYSTDQIFEILSWRVPHALYPTQPYPAPPHASTPSRGGVPQTGERCQARAACATPCPCTALLADQAAHFNVTRPPHTPPRSTPTPHPKVPRGRSTSAPQPRLAAVRHPIPQVRPTHESVTRRPTRGTNPHQSIINFFSPKY